MNQPLELKVPLTQTQNLAAAMAGEALVMMVDDEELVTELIQAYLDSAGYKRFISTTDPTNHPSRPGHVARVASFQGGCERYRAECARRGFPSPPSVRDTPGTRPPGYR